MKVRESLWTRWFLLSATAIVMLGCTRFQELTVRRHITSSLTDAEADAILLNATTVLKTATVPGDVACCVEFDRGGPVTTFTTGTGSINSGADFSAVIALPGYVKVVNTINWCGGLIPGIIGCAPIPGNSFVVVRVTPILEGILWAHEYGHTKGLGHRNDTTAVMNPFIGLTEVGVNSAECSAFLAGGSQRLFRFCGGQTN